MLWFRGFGGFSCPGLYFVRVSGGIGGFSWDSRDEEPPREGGMGWFRDRSEELLFFFFVVGGLKRK